MTASLGIHTLHVEHAFLLAVYSLLTLVNSRMHRGVRGMYWFCLYNVLAFLSALLVAFRGHIPVFLSIVTADLLVVAAYIVLSVSIARFFAAQLSGLYLQLAVLCVGTIPLLRYGWLHPDTTKRLLAHSLVLGCLQAHTAWYTLRKNKPRTNAGTSMALILASLCFMNLARIATLLIYKSPQDSLKAGDQLAWVVLVNTALQCGAMVSYVWMTASFLQRDLSLQASTDSLTGVLNRRALNLAAERVLSMSRNGDSASAISIDLDHFKKINDTYGHGCGDAALVALAGCLQQGLRDGDFLGRMGGDEFVVLLPRTSLATARMIANRLHHLVKGLDLVHQQTQIKLSASFGVAQLATAADTWDHLLGECDKLLYAAKKSRPRTTPAAHDHFFPRADEALLHPQAFSGSPSLQQSS